MKPLAYIIGCLLVFALCGCGTQSRFASSFGKRRYNKGYYWNGGEGGRTVASAKQPGCNTPAHAESHKADPAVSHNQDNKRRDGLKAMEVVKIPAYLSRNN